MPIGAWRNANAPPHEGKSARIERWHAWCSRPNVTRMRIYAAVLLLVGIAPALARAEASDVPTLTLSEALRYAQAHQPSLAAARARLEAANAQASVARAAWQPQVGALAQLVGATANNSTATQMSNGVLDLPRIGGTPMQTPTLQPYASTLIGVGARQQLFDFGRVAAQASAAEALTQVERARVEGTALTVQYAVTQAYYAVLAAHAVLDASTHAFERAKLHTDYADSAVRAGVRPPIERTRATADQARFEVGKIRAENGLRIARSVLSAALGATAAEVDAVTENDDLPPPVTPTTQAVERAVLARSPEIRVAEAQLQAQQREARAVGATMRPTLFLSATLSARAGGAPSNAGTGARFAGWLPEVPNYDAGVVLSWPLWDPLVHAKQRALEAKTTAARHELEAVKLSAVRTAQQELQRVQSAREALVAQQRALDAAKANAEQAETRFEAGLGTALELADAEAVRVDAEIQLASARFTLMTARAGLMRALAEGAP